MFSGCVNSGLFTASNKDIVKLGVVVPLSGKFAYAGEDIKNAVELAYSEKKNNNIQIIFQDSVCDNKTAVESLNNLIGQNVKIILGDWCSGGVLTMAPITEKNKMILFAQGASPNISNAGDSVFRNYPDVKILLPPILDLVKPKETMFILYPNNDFGVTYKNYALQNAQARDINIIGVESYNLNDFQDAREIVIKIKNKNPDFILFPGLGSSDYLPILKQFKEFDVNSKILAHLTLQNPDILYDKSILNYINDKIIYSYFFETNSNNYLAKEFVKNYNLMYGKEPSAISATAYDAFNILYKEIELCDNNTDCIKDALYNEDYDGVLGKTSFDKNGDVNVNIYLKTVKDGQFVVYN